MMTVELNYGDETAMGLDSVSRRPAQLAMLLRAQTLCDIDYWSRVPGIPLSPGVIETEIRRRLGMD